MEIPTKLTEYILENRVSDQGKTTIEPDEPLGLDSLGVVKMVAFLEEEFNISIADEELVPENFESLAKITKLISGKSVASA